VDSKAIAVLIIGVGIMVLVVSSVIGAPANEPFHAVSGGSPQVEVVALSLVPTIIAAAARALPLGETDIDSRASSNSACATVGEFMHQAVQPMDRSGCMHMQQDNVLGIWQCQSKFVQVCVGDFPSIGTRPPDIEDHRRQRMCSERRHAIRVQVRGDLQALG
jgi:hypothetical protein